MAQVRRTAASERRRRAQGERRREVYVTEMRDPERWDVHEVIDCEDGEVTREVWYREHDNEWCHRYTVSKSPMMRVMFKGKAPAHDEMLGLIAARTYRANEIITIYTGEDIGAAEGVLDAHKGYHRIAALVEGDAKNKGRHVMEVMKYINDDDEVGGHGPRRMWRRLIDGYDGYTCAQYMNAAYRAPKGFYDKVRLCEGGTLRVKMGCVIYAGEEMLFMYGKAYWDRWGNDEELKSPQERRVARGESGGGEQDHADRDGGGGAREQQGQGRGEPSGSGDGTSSSERVVQRGDGMRVEVMSMKRRGKRRAQEVVAPASKQEVHDTGRNKMPKGSTSVQWTAVAREAYVQQQRRFERGEGGGVT